MIYLDTSAFLKLYMRESGSFLVQEIIMSQDDPLPLWAAPVFMPFDNTRQAYDGLE